MEKMVPDLRKALEGNTKAKAKWNGLTPISRRDFISWIIQAKQDETRARRVQVSISKLLAGQRRPCCYSAIPLDLYSQLNKNTKAKTTWSTLTADEKRDYADWIHSAKKTEMQDERVTKAVQMLAAGKKYS